ncbi:exodeoxyribonuclease VII large subunit [Sunxiuqinia sp. A32]|uniref:exodeoxyribonuclease VII large subunit n=1 Tax=Sunxiuqinia sp. A32 TaxID=3461496 RepID=UPI004045314F
MGENQLTLSTLNTLIKNTLDDAFPELYWIRAEISELTINRAGHCYLELVELDEVSKEVLARTRSTIWSYSFRMLKPYFETTTGQQFSEGIKVLVHAKVEYHPVYGLSLNIRDIDPAFTMGDMARKRREILLQLEEDGVLTMNKELQLPLVPQRVAIISSPTAAGLQDFMDQLNNNPYQYKFYTKLFPAIMQGKETADSIMLALEQVFNYEDFFDVVVIIRGGGAQLDLASFDHYELAYHITQLPIPVLTGIGHDKDETVIDLVAHTKLKTPTAVAEFLITGAATFEQELLEFEKRFVDMVEDRISLEKEFLRQASQTLVQGVRKLVTREDSNFKMTQYRLQKSIPSFIHHKKDLFKQYQHLLIKNGESLIRDEYYLLEKKTDNLSSLTQRQFRMMRTKLTQTLHEIKIRLEDGFKLKENELKNFEEKNRLIDPMRILKRGYSLTYKDGQLVKSASGLTEGEQLETQFADGKVKSKIIKK